MPTKADSELIAALAPLRPYLGRYWLDSGTLLGIIRAGGLMQWDSDIDIGVWDESVEQLVAAIPAWRRDGWKVSVRRYGGRVYGLSIENGKLRPLHVHVYFRAGDTAWSPQTVFYETVDRPGQLTGFGGRAATRNLLMTIKGYALGRQAGAAWLRLLRKAAALPLWGSLTIVRNRLDRQRWSSLPLLSSIYATYTWIVPARFFDALTTIRHDGAEVSIPAAAEDYLEARYGDWRTPRTDWYYWTDDGCIVPEPPERALTSRASADALART